MSYHLVLLLLLRPYRQPQLPQQPHQSPLRWLRRQTPAGIRRLLFLIRLLVSSLVVQSSWTDIFVIFLGISTTGIDWWFGISSVPHQFSPPRWWLN